MINALINPYFVSRRIFRKKTYLQISRNQAYFLKLVLFELKQEVNSKGFQPFK